MKKTRRTKAEWIKAGIAFVVMLIGVAMADSEIYYIPITVALLAVIYISIVARRLQKRGEY